LLRKLLTSGVRNVVGLHDTFGNVSEVHAYFMGDTPPRDKKGFLKEAKQLNVHVVFDNGSDLSECGLE
jgi:hypothetical protein